MAILHPSPAGAADGWSIPAPTSRPEAALPGAGTAWLATEQDRYGSLAAVGLQPLDSLSVSLRQGWLADSLTDVRLRLRKESDSRPALLFGLHGLGGDPLERADSLLLGWSAGPLQLSFGGGWSGEALPFQGRLSPLGSIRWTAPGDRLSLAVQAGRFGLETQPRLDLRWRFLPWMELGGAWQQDRGLSATLALRLLPGSLPTPAPRPPVLSRGTDGTVWAELSRSDHPAADLGHAARLARPSPAGEIAVAGHALGMPGQRVRLLAEDLRRALAHEGSPAEIARHARIDPASRPPSAGRRLDLALAARLDLGPAPDGWGWIHRWSADGTAALRPLPGLQLSAGIRAALDDTARGLPVPVAAEPVRGDLARYAAAPLALEHLSAALWLKPLESLAVLLEAGHLEEMYGGAGLELEWRLPTARWALGLEAHQVWKRLPRDWRIQGGSGVTTGFVTARYDLDRRAMVRLDLAGGRYLGGDPGGEIAVQRRLPGGMSIRAGLVAGAEAVTARLALSIPLGRLLGPLEGAAGLRVQPLARDKGQRLERSLMLPQLTDAASYGRLAGSWNRLLDSGSFDP